MLNKQNESEAYSYNTSHFSNQTTLPFHPFFYSVDFSVWMNHFSVALVTRFWIFTPLSWCSLSIFHHSPLRRLLFSQLGSNQLSSLIEFSASHFHVTADNWTILPFFSTRRLPFALKCVHFLFNFNRTADNFFLNFNSRRTFWILCVWKMKLPVFHCRHYLVSWCGAFGWREW